MPEPVEQMDRPTVLHETGERAIYWLGIPDETAFRCNAYLIRDGDTGVIVDPGSRQYFELVRERVEQVLPAAAVSGMVLSHQDPDVAASMVEWLRVNPEMTVFTSPRTQVLLPHYGVDGYAYHDIERLPEYHFPSGSRLRFVPAPFLHFPGAFVTYDEASGFLFSGDIWAALDMDWELTITDFDRHKPQMDLFHTEYMASGLAVRGFLRNLEGLSIRAILPQHGSIIGADHVPLAIEYLRNLRCGTDIIYADLE